MCINEYYMDQLQITSRPDVCEALVDAFDSKFFKTLSAPLRIGILKFLLMNGRSDIGMVADHMPQDRSVVSRHLSLMHDVGILTCEKSSRHRFYEVNPKGMLEKLERISALLRQCGMACENAGCRG